MSTPYYPVILFDLDGTLTDPYAGIAASFLYTLEQLELPRPDEDTLRAWIGPPLHATFKRLLGDDAAADQAVAMYRSRYEPIGAFENRVYQGIPELLTDLRKAGCRLAVTTSKLEDSARMILQHFQLAPYFELLVGASRDGKLSAKADIIHIAIKELGLSRQMVVMVGDREHDVIGARTHNIPCIGVAYGYGGAAELHDAGAVAVAESVADLRKLLLDA
ncbi:MAG: HAD-IA family hydrolase [Oscillochloris sp.]|nr:HAD-IA family hydrolase [Oscillochloris sp.]